MHVSHSDQQKESIQAFEEGLSCYHKFISTVLKSEGLRRKSKEKIYRSYNQYNSDILKQI